ncbi:MAG: nicotinate phosphoribosyltransferase [Hydrogenophaga sp.]|uniref:nicotinate phosphoribosyltransferase n=1 Tax=Hydrogenophaga sp. TaxID=1904254 RepID=UPI002624E5F4|nr:nicotinate phosphoribosyltransferase [Hydrogenophaga sp.]MCV0439863.1 nicotinate phosphoribosyltransferase [Hydrogenophaga sp.]
MLNPNINLLAFGTDSYKVSHWAFYPEGTTLVYSYGEPRSGGMFPTVTFFGLQYVLSHLEGEFVTTERIDEAEEIANAHMGPGVFNRAGWEFIRDNFNGRLPLRVQAIPEGLTVNESNCLYTIQNLGGEETKWLTNWFETIISMAWYPTTVMTASREVRKIIANYLDLTGDPAGLPFKLHDFGYRGVTCIEQAAIGGGAHLATGAMGTDTMIALDFLRRYYDAYMPGFSIRATEHSIMTARGVEGEADVVRQVLDNTPNDQMVAMVGDSYDMIAFIEEILALPDIKARIEARTAPVIIRPDSGTLPKIDVDVFRALERVFGSSFNDKGFAVLPDYVRMIQGDGIKWTPVKCVSGTAWVHTVELILQAFLEERISADNIAFGSGGGLLQQFDRDSQRFAIKCSYAERDGVGYEIFKRPATDPTKNSKRGRLGVMPDVDGELITVSEEEAGEFNLLRDVFYNGIRMNLMTLEEVRSNAALPQAETV